MGTSSSYGGPGGSTPLVPSWVDADGTSAPATPTGTEESTGQGTPLGPPTVADVSAPQLPPSPGRFTVPRANLTRFARSNGTDRGSLGRAISGYVSSASGGATHAARRMGASRRTAAGLLLFLSDARARGVPAALRTLDLEALAGASVEDIFLGLVEFVCPAGGTVDDGIARDAFIETIDKLADEGISDLSALTTEQMQTVFELYATHAIKARLCNDIGAKIVFLPTNAQAAKYVEGQLHDFIRGAVADALTSARAAFATVTAENVLRFVDDVYVSAFEVLRTMGDAEDSQ